METKEQYTKMEYVRSIAAVCAVFALKAAVSTTASFFVGKALQSIFDDQED